MCSVFVTLRMEKHFDTFRVCATAGLYVAAKATPALAAGYTKPVYKGVANSVEESLPSATPGWLKTGAGALSAFVPSAVTAAVGTVGGVLLPVVTPFMAAYAGTCDEVVKDIEHETVGSLTNQLYEGVAPESAEIDRLREIGTAAD